MNALAENFRRLGEMFADFREAARGAVQGSCTECVLAHLLGCYVSDSRPVAATLSVRFGTVVPAMWAHGVIQGFDGMPARLPLCTRAAREEVERALAGYRLGQQCARWAGYEVSA